MSSFTRLPAMLAGASQNQISWAAAELFKTSYASGGDAASANIVRASRVQVTEAFRSVLRFALTDKVLFIPISAPSTDDLNITVNGAARTYFYMGNSVWVDQAI